MDMYAISLVMRLRVEHIEIKSLDRGFLWLFL